MTSLEGLRAFPDLSLTDRPLAVGQKCNRLLVSNSWYLDFTFQEIAQLGTYPFLEIAQPAPFFDWRVPGDGPVSLSNHNENMEVGFIE